MADDLIRNYIDKASFSSDTDFAKAQLADLLAAYTKVKDAMENLKSSKGTSNIVSGAQEATTAVKQMTAAITAQNQVIGQSTQIHTAQNNSLQQNIKNLNDYKKALADNAVYQKQALKDVESGKITADEYRKKITDLTEAQFKYKQAIADASKAIKDQTLLNSAAPTSILQAQTQNKQLTVQRNALPTTDTAGIAQLNALIDRNNQLIDENSDKLAKQKINIGNYSGAVNFLKTSLAEVSQKIEENTRAGKGDTAATQQLRKEQEVLTGIVESQAGGFAKATMEVKANQQALLKMKQAGMEGSEAYKQMAQATGDLKTSIKIIAAETKNLGSVSFALDGLMQGARTLAGAYGVAQGAAALFGDENKDLQKTFVKLQAIMTVINGLEAVHAALQHESSMMLGIRTLKEKGLAAIQTIRNYITTGNTAGTIANTVATGENATAQAGLATATRATSAAMVGLRFALMATGIGALLILLPLIVKGMSSFSDKTKELAKNKKALLDINTKAIESYSEEVTKLKLLVEEYKNVNTSAKRKKEIQDELQSSYPSYFADLDKHADKEAYIAEQANKATQALILQAKVQGAQKMLADKFQDLLKKQFDPTEAIGWMDVLIEKAKHPFSDVNLAIGLGEKAKENISDAEKEYKSFEQFISEFVTKSNAELSLLGGDPHKQLDKKDKEKKSRQESENIADEFRKKDLDELTKYTNTQLSTLRDMYKEMAGDQKKSLEERLFLIQKYYDASAQLIANNAKAQEDALKLEIDIANRKALKIEDPKKKADALNAIEKYRIDKLASIQQDASNATVKLNQDTYNQNTSIAEQHFDKLKKDAEEAYKFVAKQSEIAFENQKDSIDISKSEKLLQLEKDFSEGRIKNVQEYNDKKAAIEKNADIEQKQLDLERIQTAEKVFEALYGMKNLNLIKQAKDLELQIVQDSNEQILKAETELAEKKNEILDKSLTTLSSFVEASFDKQKNKRLQEEKELEAKNQREIDLVNASTLSEQQKADKITVINERSAMQKKKIDDKQAAQDIQRAKFEKAMSLLRIGISTAEAVAKITAQAAILASNPFTAAYAPIALSQIPYVIATGALEAAAVMATPIPKYRHGKKQSDNYAGPAIVGDGGVPEIIQRADGSIEKTPARDTLTYLGKDDIVFPSLMDFMIKNATPKVTAFQVKERGIDPEMINLLGKKMDNVASVIKNKKELQLGATNKGMEAIWKWGSSQTKYIDESTNW